MELSHAQRHIASGGSSAELLDDARSITDRTLHAVRDVSHFCSTLLNDLGLSAAVDWYVQSVTAPRAPRRSRVREHDRAAASEVEVTLYRIVQEG